MPYISSPTIRRRRLAAELTRLREAVGLTREEVGERLEWERTKVWRVETARSGITPRDMRDVLDLYGVTGEHRDALIALARHARQRGWWTKYKDVFHGSFIELEAQTAMIRTFEPNLIPGLLQIERYTRALLRADPLRRNADDIDRRIAARVERQHLLNRENAPTFWAVIDENAITKPVGGPETMREQLQRLIDLREAPNITLQVIPTALGAHPGMNGPFVLLDFPNPDYFGPVVYLETMTDGLYLEEAEEIAAYTLTFDHLRAVALGSDETVRLLQATMNNLNDGE